MKTKAQGIATTMAAAVLAVAAVPLAAQADVGPVGPAVVTLNVYEGGGGVYADVMVESRFHLYMRGTLDIEVNSVKVQSIPVETATKKFLTLRVARRGDQIAVCARFTGAISGYGDTVIPAEDDACSVLIPTPGSPLAPLARVRLAPATFDGRKAGSRLLASPIRSSR